MNILEVNKFYYPWIGGVETIVQQIAEGLNKQDNVSVTVLCCQSEGGEVVEHINHVSVVRAHRFATLFKMPLSISFFEHFKYLSQKADIIDLHHPFPLGFLAALLFNTGKTKLVVHYHSDIVKQKISGFLITPLLKAVLKRAVKIIISNPNLLTSSLLLKKYKDKCVVIPFGVNIEETNKLISLSRVADIKKDYGEFVLYVGRLSYYKGVEYLIKAMRGVDRKLIIIGEGPERQYLENKVREFNLQTQVIWLPPQPQSELINFFKAAEVFVLPSIYKSEAFGIVLIQAMASGTPVISTELRTGTSFVNLNEQTGYVVPPKDSEKLHEVIQRIILHPELRMQLGNAAKERVKQEFSLSSMLEKHKQIFRELI